jgi:Spy/CpxP family protein refolding chaperone
MAFGSYLFSGETAADRAFSRNAFTTTGFPRLMKHHLLTIAIVGATWLSAANLTLAQDAKPDAGQAGRGGRMTPEARLKSMTESLALTQEQQTKIKAILEANQAKFTALRDLPQDERRTKMRDLTQAQNDEIDKVLTAEQKEKAKAERAKRAAERGARPQN